MELALVPEVPRVGGNKTTQFMLAQLLLSDDGKGAVKTPYGQPPSIEGTKDQPDIAVKDLTLESFHIDRAINIEKDTVGFLRVTTGNQADQTDDLLNWAITTGIDLYQQSQLKDPKQSKMDQKLSAHFKTQPIQMLGGLGQLHVEIVKSKKPAWWQDLLHFFATSPAVKTVAATFGLPGLAQQALGFVDELVNKTTGQNAEVLISSDILPLAFSKLGQDSYKKIGAGRIGVMNPGTWVLTKVTDLPVLQRELPWFAKTYGRLVPNQYLGNVDEFLATVAADETKDPFYHITYAVLTADLEPHKFAV